MKRVFSNRGTKSDTEFTDYQKVIEETENVILCVAKAEKMVRQLGRSLVERQRESPEQIAAPFDMDGTDNE